MTGTACLTSARLAAEMGAFPAWPDNAGTMQRVMRQHADSAARLAGGRPEIEAAVRAIWDAACDEGACNGYRNAQVSHIVDADAEAALLDCTARGIEPLPSLVRFDRLPAGGWHKTIEPAVPRGLRALGYTPSEIDAILHHVLGHGTLAHAPGVNHETLRKRGFTERAICSVEAALPTASDIRQLFSRWILGETYCRRMLGFTAQELEDEDFDMLAALGFSDAGVEAANVYCCGGGTLEGAPYLDPDHLVVFDCAAGRTQPSADFGRQHHRDDGGHPAGDFGRDRPDADDASRGNRRRLPGRLPARLAARSQVSDGAAARKRRRRRAPARRAGGMGQSAPSRTSNIFRRRKFARSAGGRVENQSREEIVGRHVAGIGAGPYSTRGSWRDSVKRSAAIDYRNRRRGGRQ
jgi:hypothetical protein